jgi:hypothetical protein
MKWLKGILVFVGLIIVLFAIGLVLIIVYKKEILAEVSRQIKQNINAEVTIRDADITLFSEFPNFTLKLDDVEIKDVFATKTILVNVRTYKLFYKEIEFRSVKIIDGNVFLYRTRSGSSNLDVFKKNDSVGTDSTRDFRLTKEKILFQNLRFTWHDSLRNKFIGFLLKEVDSDVQHYDSLIECRMNGSIDFEQLTFNATRGSFLKNMPSRVSLSFDFLPDSSKLRLRSSTLSLHNSEFDISGVFDFPGKNIQLDIASDQLEYNEGLAVIPETIARKLSILSVTKPFAINVHLDAPMKAENGEQPWVDVKFDLKDNVFKSNVVTITDLSLNGTMSNHEDPGKPFDNKNSTVKLRNVVGKIDELPFKARAILSNFDDVALEIFSKHKVTLSQLNREVDTTTIHFNDGNFVSEFHYKGKLNEYFDPQTGTYKGDLEGRAMIEKGSFTLIARKLDFKDINMAIRFNEDTVWIDNLGIAAGKTPVKLQGLITNYVPFFTKPVNKGYVQLKITSPNVDLQNFLVKKSGKKKSAKQSKEEKRKVSDMLDKIFTNLQFDIELGIDKLKNRNFNASKISGKIKLTESALEATNLKMNFAGGKLNMSMKMKDLQKDVNPIDVTAKGSGIAIKELFRSFDNFNQKSFTDKNLEGTMSFDTKLKLKINDDFNVLLPTFRGDVSMVVKDGRLINVEAIHNMSNFLFRRRDFDDVRFAQINGKVKVTHRDMDISRMEIQSTVLSIFLEGKYSLDNDTNLSIQVPLSNLKKRDKNFVPKNVGTDARVGPSVFLLAKTTEDGKTDIAYDGLRLKDKSKKKKPR